MKKVAVAESGMEARYIEELLLQKGVPSFSKPLGAGSYLNAAFGFSIYGEEIFVPEEEYDKALELIQENPFREGKVNELSFSDDEDQGYEQVFFEQEKQLRKTKRILAFVLSLPVVAIIVLSVYFL